jgi:hypothetical protein
LKKDFAVSKAKRVQDAREIQTNAQTTLKEFHDAHAAMSATLKQDLGQFATDLAGKTRDLLDGFQGERAEMAADGKKATAHWRDLTATLAKHRAGMKPQVKQKEAPVEAPREAKQVAQKEIPVEPPLEQGKGEEAEKKNLMVEVPLEEKVLKFIETHPEGVTVGDMEEPLETPRSILGKVAKELWNEEKLRKEGKTYFPV